jgi:hypothetical protein
MYGSGKKKKAWKDVVTTIPLCELGFKASGPTTTNQTLPQ